MPIVCCLGMGWALGEHVFANSIYFIYIAASDHCTVPPFKQMENTPDARDPKRPRVTAPAAGLPSVYVCRAPASASAAEDDAVALGWPRGATGQDEAVHGEAPSADINATGAAAEADADALGWPLRGPGDQDEMCMVPGPDTSPLAGWEGDDDETYESFESLHYWHQGSGGGNPHPETARAGGSAARVNKLAESFRLDVTANCNEYHPDVFPKCPFGGICRSVIGSDWFRHDFTTYRLEATALRARFHAMATEEKEDVVREIIEKEHKQHSHEHGESEAVATVHVGTVGVCVAAFAWMNGWSSHVYKRARVKVNNPDRDVPDGRRLNSGQRGGTLNVKIIAWGNHALPHMGDWKPVPGTIDQETLVLAYISPEHHLFPRFYWDTFHVHLPADDHVCTYACRDSTKSDHKLACSVIYFVQVLRRAFSHKHHHSSGARFSAEFHDCPVTGRCPVCIRLLACARAAEKRGDQGRARAFKRDFDAHQASQFRERVVYRGDMASAIATHRALRRGDYPHNVVGECKLVYGLDGAATKNFSLGLNPGGERRHSKQELYTGPTLGCKVVACVLNGLNGDEDHTVFVVLPCWVAWDANAILTIIYDVIYEKILRPFLDKQVLPPTSVAVHSDRGGDEWSAVTLMAHQYLSQQENLGGVVDQCALVSKHGHCIFDRMIAMMLHHVRVTNNGAMTYQGLVDSINSMDGCSAVFLDRARDLKDHLLPSCWEGLHDHREPLWFHHEGGELFTRLTAADAWEHVGNITTTPFPEQAPSIAVPFVATRVGIGDSPEKRAAAREKALRAALGEEATTRSRIRSLRKFAESAPAAILAIFGNGRYDGDAGRDKVLAELDHMVALVPCVCGQHGEPNGWAKSGEFALPWPLSWVLALRGLRANPGTSAPPSADTLHEERAAAASKLPPQKHSRVPAVPTAAAIADASSPSPQPANAHLIECGNFHLYYEQSEPLLHVCQVLRFEVDGEKSVDRRTGWGTLLSGDSTDASDRNVTVVCQRWDCRNPPPPGTAQKLAKREHPVEWDPAQAVWVGQPASEAYLLRLEPCCLGPKVNLKNADCTLYKRAVTVYTEALTALVDGLEAEGDL
jgi:hypothetical protein